MGTGALRGLGGSRGLVSNRASNGLSDRLTPLPLVVVLVSRLLTQCNLGSGGFRLGGQLFDRFLIILMLFSLKNGFY